MTVGQPNFEREREKHTHTQTERDKETGRDTTKKESNKNKLILIQAEVTRQKHAPNGRIRFKNTLVTYTYNG